MFNSSIIQELKSRSSIVPEKQITFSSRSQIVEYIKELSNRNKEIKITTKTGRTLSLSDNKIVPEKEA